MVWNVITIANEEQELNSVDLQPANQDSMATKVVDKTEDLGWGAGAVWDQGNWVADAGDNNMDIEIVVGSVLATKMLNNSAPTYELWLVSCLGQ